MSYDLTLGGNLEACPPMSCHALCRVRKGMITCALLLAAMNPFASAKEKPSTFYYLAVPTCQRQERLISVACIKLDRHGLPAEGKAKGSDTPFFSLWYSAPWEEAAPDDSVRNVSQWKEALEAKAERALAKDEAMSQLPAPIVRFFLEIEKLRCVSPRDVIVQPLFKSRNFVGWEQVKRLDVVASASPLSAEERSKTILWSLHEIKGTDPAKNLEALLSCVSIKTQSVRYWPRYNVFLIEAGADFDESIQTLFSPMY